MSHSAQTPPESLTRDVVQLRRRLCDAVERLTELERNRSALEEIVHGLNTDAERLRERLKRTVDEGGALDAAIAAKAGRTDTMADEIDEADERRAQLERRRGANAQRVEKLGHVELELKERISGFRQSRRHGEHALGGIHNSVIGIGLKVDRDAMKPADSGDASRPSTDDLTGPDLTDG